MITKEQALVLHGRKTLLFMSGYDQWNNSSTGSKRVHEEGLIFSTPCKRWPALPCSALPIEPGIWLQEDIMTFQETLQSLSPTAQAQLQTFLEVLQQRISPTDWERLQTFLEGMHPERRAAMMAFVAQRE